MIKSTTKPQKAKKNIPATEGQRAKAAENTRSLDCKERNLQEARADTIASSSSRPSSSRCARAKIPSS